MTKRTDFNDLAAQKGPAAVRDAVSKASAPAGDMQPAADRENAPSGDFDGPAANGMQASEAKGSVCRFDADGNRVIRHDQGRLPEIIDQLGIAVAAAPELNVFEHAGRPARVYPAHETKGGNVHRPKGALILHPIDAAHLCELAGRAARHEKFDARSDSYRRTDCPRRAAEAYLARGAFPELRRLAGFIEAPTVTSDGHLIDAPGYDQATGLFLAMGSIPGYERPPTRISKAKAANAKERLLAAVAGFPFVEEADQAATIAGMLTALLRRAMPAAPMIGITAPSPGTGKTLLAETFAILATGRRGSVLSLGHDEAESEKRLGGVLLAGDPAILLDNIERPLGGDVLCQALTQQTLRIRPLGASGMVSVPTSALIVATGNNLAITGDLKRRVALIRLDARQERPEQRQFTRDHLQDVYSTRGELIAAALSIPLAYIRAGAPTIDGLHPLGGFELWDRMVRRPLVWLGLPDPLTGSEELRDQDPDMDAMRQMFAAWRALFGDEAKTAAEAVTAGMDSFMGQSADPVRHELRDAMQLACAEKINARRLGYWLRARRDRIVDGLQLVQGSRDGHAKIARWRVQDCGRCRQ